MNRNRFSVRVVLLSVCLSVLCVAQTPRVTFEDHDNKTDVLIGGKQEEAKVLGVLKAAAGFLRTELAQKVRLKHTPELNFIWDDSIEHGDRILRLIDQVSTEYET